MMIFTIVLTTFLATLLGGAFALRFRDRLHLTLGFSAGAVIGVAFLEILPEAIDLAKELPVATVTALAALGFVFFMILDRFIIFHGHHSELEVADHLSRGKLGAGSLSVHSFLDGLAIGLAFQVSAAVGTIVTIAVLTHDFSDGINTVNLILKNGGTKRDAERWLLVDAIAPVLGVTATLFFSVPETVLGIILALFSGSFLYIGASDLLPESHHAHPTVWTTILTVLGVAVLYLAVKLAGV